jgi:hypothetical protein
MNEFVYGAIVILGFFAVFVLALDTWAYIVDLEQEQEDAER